MIKSVIPLKLWRKIRKRLIMWKYSRVAALLKPYVEACKAGNLESFLVNKKIVFPDNAKIVWQYWGQGYNDGDVPELVRICLASVDKYVTDCTIIRLSDQNLSQYIDLPQILLKKKDKMPLANFSDILRCFLLATYGGLWLDVSVLLTGKLPDMLFKQNFFMYQRDPNELYKKYWENSFAYYWGWGEKFKVNTLVGIMYAKPNNNIVGDFCKILMSFWKRNDKLPDYFLFQILIDVYKQDNPEWKIPVVSDTIPHLLRQKINGDYPYATIEEILNLTTIHSLSRKNDEAVDKLKKVLEFYGK